MAENKVNAVLYVRVSSREQAIEGYSIEAQRRFLVQHAAAAGFQIVAEFSDEETAKTTGRPGFEALLAYIRSRSDVRTILVEKTDRLLRNFRDFITIDEAEIDVVFAKEGTTFGPNSHSSQRFLQTIKVGMARHYIENLSEEVKKGLHEKCRLDGAWPALAPLGYRNVSDAFGIAPDPVKAPLVKQLFEEAARGDRSHRTLAAFAYDIGLRTRDGHRIGKSHIAKIISNPLYAGQFSWGGKQYEGKYEPLVTTTLFHRVQHALSAKSKSKTRKFLFPLSGLLSCGVCGGRMSGDLKVKVTSKARHEFVYYSCGGRMGCREYFPERIFETKIVSILDSLKLDGAVSAWIGEELARWYDTSTEQEQVEKERRERRIGQLRTRMRKAWEEKEEGTLDAGSYRSFVSDWQAEIDELLRSMTMARPTVSRGAFLRAGAAPLELLQAAPALYVTQSREEKNALCKIVFSNLTVAKDDGEASLSADLCSPFDALVGIGTLPPGSGDWLGRKDSNLRMSAPKADALPLGDSPTKCRMHRHESKFRMGGYAV